MPPRSSLTSSFSVSDANNEVVCPLTNNDGSNCRKRCLGEKRYRSMQEHIRRAHPNYYIPKLPATEESFQLMVNTPPDQRPHQQPPAPTSHPRRGPSDRDIFARDQNSPATPRTLEEAHPAAATAAVALAQLQHHRLMSEWDSEVDAHSDSDIRRDRMRSSVELPPLRDHFKQESIPPFSPRPRELLPSILAHSPPGRSSTLPPIQRREKIQRARKGSLTQARKGKHERTRSKEYGRRSSINERKALSAEPQTAAWVQGKRWEDLIEAATSATEVDDDRDMTPVPHSPPFRSLASVTSAPSVQKHRSSLPPAFQSTPGLPPAQSSYPRQFAPLSYTASPLQKALTPPPYEHSGPPDTDLEPFPSVESSLDSNSSVSGKNFHMSASGLPPPMSDSSPVQPPRPGTSSYPLSSHPHQLQPHIRNRIHHRLSNPTPFGSHNGKDVQIYCASCSRPWPLRECLACTECICGVCRECVSMMSGTIGASPASILNPTSNPGNGISGNGNISAPRTGLPGRRGCPSCGTISGKWKNFQLDFR
ncbi:hypothetical protein D8B26_002102 [Coccidioides posadasii str. Silveira]|uniref:Transcription factor RfeD n=1 Tax=Coccidioides posadasii (strain RMSCC 757 / Silveira) TaxID=443226 RepID=E9CUV5_COCPS|nr:transcription factor RfeD [Coccidioides posadasii str. Silveira]QVM07403.1 hypothetical protein D8B26_002102 [Coccidioides posadasii str. Silveira]